MTDKIDTDFKKYVGIDLLTATRVLMKNGIVTNDIENSAIKLFKGVIEDVESKNLDDDYMILLHTVLTYYIFSNALRAYDDWIKEEAALHNMKHEKYIKIIFS